MNSTSAFPAKAGIQTHDHNLEATHWIPAFAGNTVESAGTILVLRQAQDEDE